MIPPLVNNTCIEKVKSKKKKIGVNPLIKNQKGIRANLINNIIKRNNHAYVPSE